MGKKAFYEDKKVAEEICKELLRGNKKSVELLYRKYHLYLVSVFI
jgi:hypothetical protein